MVAAESDAVAGFGDIYPMAQLFWNKGPHNWMAYVTGSVPVGNFLPRRLSNLGRGHGAIDVGGATYISTPPRAENSQSQSASPTT